MIEGEYAICVARSSENIIAEYWTEFKEQKPKIIDEKMPLGEFLTNEKYRPIVLRYLLNAIKIWAYGDAKAEGDFEMDEFLRCSVYNMPIRAFLYFSDGKFDGDTIEKLLNELKSL